MVLQIGSRGENVRKVQLQLLALGYELPKFGADGRFGKETEEAVREFQEDNDLQVDGIVGPETLDLLMDEEIEPEPTPQPKPATVTPAKGDPVWLTWALGKLGDAEVPGPGDNPEIVSWMKLTSLPPSMRHDATAWCSVFVNAGFELNGYKGTGSADAGSWLNWGHAVDPVRGAVCVFARSGGHHVAYLLNDLGDSVEVVGGNQSDKVCKQTYLKDGSLQLLAYRGPQGWPA